MTANAVVTALPSTHDALVKYLWKGVKDGLEFLPCHACPPFAAMESCVTFCTFVRLDPALLGRDRAAYLARFILKNFLD